MSKQMTLRESFSSAKEVIHSRYRDEYITTLPVDKMPKGVRTDMVHLIECSRENEIIPADDLDWFANQVRAYDELSGLDQQIMKVLMDKAIDLHNQWHIRRMASGALKPLLDLLKMVQEDDENEKAAQSAEAKTE